jgi:hypothetical protein
MKMPVMSSTPGRSAGRPDIVAPKQTSCSPLYRDSSSAHAPCTTALVVRWWHRTNSLSRRDSVIPSFTETRSDDRLVWVSLGTRS